MVFFDIGGVMYDDTVYARSWREALREWGASFTDEEFAAEYAAARAEQSWAYPPTALYPDVVPCLEALSGGVRLGVIANQPSSVRAAMERDGLARFFEVWGVSDDLGLQKPDPELFSQVLATARVDGSRTMMVGDRLDYDVRPAAAAGMRTVWVLRGEAPDDPSPEQLAEAGASVRDLTEVPALVASWS